MMDTYLILLETFFKNIYLLLTQLKKKKVCILKNNNNKNCQV